MNTKSIHGIVEAQRAFHRTGATLSLKFRKKQLAALKRLVEENEGKIIAALKADLGKCDFEAYTGEVMTTLQEVKFAIRRLRKWMRPKRVASPPVYWPIRSEILAEPFGVSLIIAPWNYPFFLITGPLIGAIAAGNCVVVKPSEVSTHTSKLFAQLIGAAFPPEYIAVVEGGVKETQTLLAEKFDLVFYTGNPTVGRIVMKAAAEHLTPVVLELGGKSPCFVHEDVNIETAARRIVWGKFFNAGQTCVAPDYLLVHKKIRKQFVIALAAEIERRYGKNPEDSPDYARIINDKHVQRLAALLKGPKVACGGEVKPKAKYISPTILTSVKFSHAVMADEIFGPILPVIEYDSIEEAAGWVKDRPKPLALYVYTRDRKLAQHIIRTVPSGGACVNDNVIHFSSTHLPIGGVGDSGMGRYHGKASFDAFTHFKSVMLKPFTLDNPLRYPPYLKLTKFWKFLLGKLV